MDGYAISVRNLSKRYKVGDQRRAQSGGLIASARRLFAADSDKHNTIWAINDVSFQVKKGERLGFVGRNGAGKSTLLKILSRIVYPTSGEARIRGRVTSLLEVGTGFVNHLTGRQNIYLNASFHGLSKRQVNDRFAQIVEFSELEKFIDTPIKHYSSGMRARLAFSVAAHLDPDILLLDEVLSVGDMAFAQKCLQRVQEMTTGDRTILFVSHSMDSVRRFCNRCIWLDCGRVVMDGTAEEVTDAYTNDSMTLKAHQTWAGTGEEISPTNMAEGETQLFPDGPHARLVSASVLAADGRQTATVSVADETRLEVIFDVLVEGASIVPYFRIHTDQDMLAFNAIYPAEESALRRCEARRYKSAVVIPPHLLNTGRHYVSVGLCTPNPGKIARHDEAQRALSFYVHEAPFGVPSSLGPFNRVPGVIRPLLKWEPDRAID